MNPKFEIRVGECRQLLREMPADSVHCVMTSPPYFGLRDYNAGEGEIGSEASLAEFVETMVEVFAEVRCVLRPDGVCWVNLGDSFKQKNKMMVPARVAIALCDDGWYLRDEVVWHKPNPMPFSVKDRCSPAWESVFQLTKSPKYYYDYFRVQEPVSGGAHSRGNNTRRKVSADGSGIKSNSSFFEATGGDVATRNPRNVWSISIQGYKEAHFATYPLKLCELPIRSSTCEEGCCSICGASQVREFESVRRATRPGENTKIKVPGGWDTTEGSHGTVHRNGRTEAEYRDTAEVGNRDPQRHVTELKHVGWKPGCECGAEFEPCTVLDPFCGSGTTGVVALQHGCNFIGLELNPEYAEMARNRIAKATRQRQLFAIH